MNQLATTNDLISVMLTIGLFTDEQAHQMTQEVLEFTDTTELGLHMIEQGKLTRYQLKKILAGRAAELRVGQYVISKKIGNGGMGKVYSAKRQIDGATVALKIIRPGLLDNPIIRGRYAREVQTTGSLNHSNIVRFYEAGEDSGRFYLAMEFVDGCDLARLIHDHGRAEVAEGCEYARQAALGLQHAHECGFIHRDIKPGNIVVSGERHLPHANEPALVKILDLGLARAIDPDDMVVPNLTRDHSVVGTADYMAPEQAKNSKRADARSDLYSLGCTMYFILTGRVPFPHGGAIDKIIAHQNELALPLQALRPEVPDGVARLVAKLMAKRPEDRFQTAGELAVALAPFARHPAGTEQIGSETLRDDPFDTVQPGGSPESDSADDSDELSSGIFTFLEESREKPKVTPANSTPRRRVGTGDVAIVKSHVPITQPLSRADHRRDRRETPPILWATMAAAGVAIIALMLLYLSK